MAEIAQCEDISASSAADIPTSSLPDSGSEFRTDQKKTNSVKNSDEMTLSADVNISNSGDDGDSDVSDATEQTNGDNNVANDDNSSNGNTKSKKWMEASKKSDLNTNANADTLYQNSNGCSDSDNQNTSVTKTAHSSEAIDVSWVARGSSNSDQKHSLLLPTRNNTGNYQSVPSSGKNHFPHRSISPTSNAHMIPQWHGVNPNQPNGSHLTTSSGQHIVHLHVNPGESISFQIGDQMQLIQD